MFSNIKNKIKEETGYDLSKVPPVINSSQSKLGRGRSSNPGSTSSLASIGSFSIDGVKEESPGNINADLRLADGKAITPKEFKKLEAKEDEWRKKLEKKEEELTKLYKKSENEWKKQAEEKEKEWKKILDRRDKEKFLMEQEKQLLYTENIKLKENLKNAEDYKKKVCQYQEDIDQLEGFQTQELAKIKHLLLVKEQEILEKDTLIKETQSQLDTMKLELIRLRKFEQEYEETKDNLESARHTFDLDKAQLTSKLASSEEEIRHLQDRVMVLEERTKSEFIGLGAQLSPDERVQVLLGERTLLERRLEEAHLHLTEVKSSWSGKISSLETQVERLCRQASEESNERRKAEQEVEKLNKNNNILQEENNKLNSKLENKNNKISRLKIEMEELEENLRNQILKYEEDVKKLKENIDSTSSHNLELQDLLQKHQDELQTLTEDKNKYEKSLENEQKNTLILEKERNKIKQDLEVEKCCNLELRKRLELETQEKDEMMMRNAQVSQDVELVKQQLREQTEEVNELNSKIIKLEEVLIDKEKDLEKLKTNQLAVADKLIQLDEIEMEKQRMLGIEHELKSEVTILEEQLLSKNKSIKVLQQRLTDMKKTLQKELKLSSTSIDPGGDDFISSYSPSTNSGSSTAILTPSSHHSGGPRDDDDVNFKYLKHVLMKFLTSREYEAQHLTRAVATLLKFSPEEEKLLKETLDWKMSWFGSKPNLGNGQTCKTLPQS